MKRVMDLVLALIGLTVLSPLLLMLTLLIFLQDFRHPLYIAERIGRDGKPFRMIKLRSMISGADRTGVMSTSANDSRITVLGRTIRKWKLDEIPQLINVVTGDMSLVGPRPNVRSEVALYTHEERRTLQVQPGITDIASIVFSDESAILAGQGDPDLAYRQLIRPWKSRLGLFYVDHISVGLDARILLLTALSLVSRDRTLVELERTLNARGADEALCAIAARRVSLVPMQPPGLINS